MSRDVGFGARGGWWVVGQGAAFVVLAGLALWGPRVDPPVVVVLGGWVLVAAAGWLAGDGLVRIRRHLTPYPAPLDGAPLIAGGAFGLVRHPIYGGLVLGFVGVGLVSGNLALAAGGLGLAVFFTAKSAHEEQLLVAAMPEYATYRDRVPRRLLPWVW